jgi:hypothetical protein
MSESSENKDDRGVSKDDPAGGIHSEGGEGAENEEATPPISEDGEHGQTQVPAPDDDAGSKED